LEKSSFGQTNYICIRPQPVNSQGNHLDISLSERKIHTYRWHKTGLGQAKVAIISAYSSSFLLILIKNLIKGGISERTVQNKS
jgi:hypothetical protein